MKGCNYLLLIVFLVFFASCQNRDVEKKVISIHVMTVDFSILTIAIVNCDDFEKSFQNSKQFCFTDSIQINELLHQFADLERTDSTYSKFVDTRAKIEINSNIDTTIVCVGYYSLVRNNVIYKTPEKLIELIEGYRVKIQK